MGLFYATLKDDTPNTERSVQLHLDEKIAEIFKTSEKKSKRYKFLLQTISEIAKTSEDAATNFVMRSNVHGELLNDIKKTYVEYKKNSNFVNNDQEISKNEIKNKFEIFSA